MQETQEKPKVVVNNQDLMYVIADLQRTGADYIVRQCKHYDACAVAVNNHVFVAVVAPGTAPESRRIKNRNPDNIVSLIMQRDLYLHQDRSLN